MRLAGWMGAATATLVFAAGALAQHFDTNHAHGFVVGPPDGASPMERVDARRSGFAATGLPAATLRMVWHRSIGQDTENAPLVASNGDVFLLGARGEVVVFDHDGVERRRISVGTGASGPGTFTSDGTLVFVNGAGEAVGLRSDTLRYRTRVGERGALVRAAPLPLDDGGVVVASGASMAALDSEGNVRARTTLPDVISQPLLPGQSGVLAVTATGAVYAWPPGRDASRVGSFGTAVDGPAVLASPHTLLAIVDGAQISALELSDGVAFTRAIAGAGVFLPPLALRGATSYGLELTPSSTLAVAIDPNGREVLRAVVATSHAAALADGGAPLASWGSSSTLVDPSGSFAFGTAEGLVGVLTATGAVETLGEPLCVRTRPSSAPGGSGHGGQGFAGLAPAGRGAFLVACMSGQVSSIAE